MSGEATAQHSTQQRSQAERQETLRRARLKLERVRRDCDRYREVYSQAKRAGVGEKQLETIAGRGREAAERVENGEKYIRGLEKNLQLDRQRSQEAPKDKDQEKEREPRTEEAKPKAEAERKPEDVWKQREANMRWRVIEMAEEDRSILQTHRTEVEKRLGRSLNEREAVELEERWQGPRRVADAKERWTRERAAAEREAARTREEGLGEGIDAPERGDFGVRTEREAARDLETRLVKEMRASKEAGRGTRQESSHEGSELMQRITEMHVAEIARQKAASGGREASGARDVADRER